MRAAATHAASRPSSHHAQRDDDQAVAEAAERDRLGGQAAQRQRRADVLAGGALQRDADPDVALAGEVDLEGRVRLRHRGQRQRGHERRLARAERGDGELLRRARGPHQERDVAVGQLVDLRGDRLVQAVARDQHAHELGARSASAPRPR